MLIRLLTESGDVTVRRVTAGAADPVRPREPAAIWQHA
jgi:hypothetical protein